ncbi:MAG: DUF1592 domain-containing protein [Acidobacteria bacterium]|nr:DUF1592 domain-containing protein [Acidobacteriota bacterium]MDA1235871.1 DUF1592 domain-containing protein [Acidobacteriota bacterium]
MVRKLVSRTLLTAAALALGTTAWGQTTEAFFASELYPLLHRTQCNLCHNDNGVAGRTAFQFPEDDATAEQIAAFGLEMIELIDRDDVLRSRLLLKPTQRIEHTGGERIKPGSVEEQTLLTWIRYLANLDEAQVQTARERIRRASTHQQQALSIRRLTHSQYNNTLRDLLGDQTRPADSFPKEDFVHGFKNAAEAQGIPPLLAEAYSAAAERAARGAFRGGDHQGLVSCKPAGATDAACAETFVRQFGAKAFRRPLNTQEVGVYSGLLREEGARLNDFLDGAQIVVEAMLQSPNFLFRTEHGPGSEFGQFETASRLSYFLWDTMPSAELRAAAEAGKLGTAGEIDTVAQGMLKDPRARTSMDEFLAQWLRFDRALTATRERRLFGTFNPELAAAMTEETRQLFGYLVWEGRDFREFFSADYTFPSSALAELYAMRQPPEEYAKVPYPADSGRAGVLGQGTILTLTSSPSDTSPTGRGLFVREHFLCQQVPPPPPGVNTTLPMVTESKPLTNRQRLEIHLNSAPCKSCHMLIDPIGVGFEQYDAIGRNRDQLTLTFQKEGEDDDEKKKPVEVKIDLDTSAHVQGIENSDFKTPKELGKILANDPTCQRCVVKQLFRYAMGREEKAADQPAIDAMLARFQSTGFQFRELMIALVKSEPFMGGGLE